MAARAPRDDADPTAFATRRGGIFGFAVKSLALLAAAGVSACTVGPDYLRPEAPVSAGFKELKGWKPAHPSDAMEKGRWWAIFRDPELDRLASQVEVTNQNVASQLAAYEQAQALVRESQASLFPSLSATWSGQRSGDGKALSGVGRTLASGVSYPQGNVSWTLDVWGKVRRQIENSAASAQSDLATLENAKLSAQAQLAIAYFNLRTQDMLRALLARTITAYQETQRITRNQYNSGTVSQADLITAETQVLAVQAQYEAAAVSRAQYEHAIAALIGRPPADLTIKTGGLPHLPPAVPATLPSTLLERRPDIAAAERTMQAQNALVGVAVAAYYPEISFSAGGGFQGANAFPFTAAHLIWSIGAQATDPIFDGGLRAAQTEAAQASYRMAVANYRQTVLTAFQQVEDELVALRLMARELKLQEQARDKAAEAVKVYLNQYRAGTVAFTTVVVAEATLLSDEESVLTTRQSLFNATVYLIEYLGGGFDASELLAEQPPPLTEAVARSLPIPPQ
ncbi:transporter [Rhodoblastus sphagnicola]|uniref:Transporter n=1 Tax=Rhodoblastus sphagnicola TaxID=333368 RepID=A0A2S6N9B2_9HYPH|nr:efflux transporter outer membrane subunit [Rhodoblastus sphagnicola]MBB4196509.1 NodT family efflux transporter outer membrane factor (OMF) lipoprotein [Rhodoblastus sphagnicola]PPQ31205.1 transporter [Rhodoblastus sphagnicola]